VKALNSGIDVLFVSFAPAPDLRPSMQADCDASAGFWLMSAGGRMVWSPEVRRLKAAPEASDARELKVSSAGNACRVGVRTEGKFSNG
jgi:hypothetical protein